MMNPGERIHSRMIKDDTPTHTGTECTVPDTEGETTDSAHVSFYSGTKNSFFLFFSKNS